MSLSSKWVLLLHCPCSVCTCRWSNVDTWMQVWAFKLPTCHPVLFVLQHVRHELAHILPDCLDVSHIVSYDCFGFNTAVNKIRFWPRQCGLCILTRLGSFDVIDGVVRTSQVCFIVIQVCFCHSEGYFRVFVCVCHLSTTSTPTPIWQSLLILSSSWVSDAFFTNRFLCPPLSN